MASEGKVFVLWMDYGYAGIETVRRKVRVPPGENEEEYLREAMNELVYNELDTGWAPAEEFAEELEGIDDGD